MSKTLANRSSRLLATIQRAPLRTLAESDSDSLPVALGSETSLPGAPDVAVIYSQVSQAEAKRPRLPGPRSCVHTNRDSRKP